MSKSRSLNKVMLIGNLTRSPVLKETSGGVQICSFGVATNTSWKDKDGQIKEKAEYHNLIAFNKLAEICAMVLDVGMLVYAEGELRNRVFDGDDGKKFYRTEIKLNDMYLLDSKGKKGVGIDAAKEGMDHSDHSEPELHVEPQTVTEVPVKPAEEADKDEFKSEDLF
ncbi:MAG: single-stranded DNA-binding protein [Candidatus Dojkabacteria bacterium]